MEDEEDLDDDRVNEPTPVQPRRRRVKFVDSTGKESIIGDANTEPDGPKPKNITLPTIRSPTFNIRPRGPVGLTNWTGWRSQEQ